MTVIRGGGVQGPSLDPAEARELMALFKVEAGLSFAEGSGFVLERRLRDRVVSLGLQTFTQYVTFLRSGGPTALRELEEALEIVTTHETYFFREEYQLKAFRDEVLPMLFRQGETKRRLTVWSAGCSTGEEAYTLAMVIDSCEMFRGWDVRIIGSDLSRKCLSTARKAVYGRGAFRAVPREYMPSNFIDDPEGTRVAPHIKSMCTFLQMNLLHPERGGFVGRVDAIFCRNVLIYLDGDARMKVIETLYDHLLPGGFLMLGHSESLLNVSCDFEVVHLREDLVYRRPELDVSGRARGDSR